MKKVRLLLLITVIFIVCPETGLAKKTGKPHTNKGKGQSATQFHHNAGQPQRNRDKTKTIEQKTNSSGSTLKSQQSNHDVNHPSRKVPKAVEIMPPVGKALGKGHQQQLTAINEQIKQEEQKHLERLAKLWRIAQLARKKSNTALINKAEQLRLKEQHRYERKMQKLEQRRQKIMQLAAQTSDEFLQKTETKAKIKSDTGKKTHSHQKQQEYTHPEK